MRKKLTKPAPGTPISSSLICDIIDELESLRLIETPGVRFGRSPNGTRVFVSPPNPARTAASETPGCFEIRKPTEAESPGESGSEATDEDPGGFDNCYLMIGGKIYNFDYYNEIKRFGYENMKDVFVYVKIDLTLSSVSPTIETAETFVELQEAAREENYAVIPIYKFGEKEGLVEVDFRKMPSEIAGEFRP